VAVKTRGVSAVSFKWRIASNLQNWCLPPKIQLFWNALLIISKISRFVHRCRTIFLLVDRDDVEKDRGSLQQLSIVHAHRVATSFFCLHDGLVNVPGKIDCTEKDFELIRKRVSPCINRAHLAKIRGDRQEGTIRTSNKVESTLDAIEIEIEIDNEGELSTVSGASAGEQIIDSLVDEAELVGEVTDWDASENEGELSSRLAQDIDKEEADISMDTLPTRTCTVSEVSTGEEQIDSTIGDEELGVL
jgi:hypothetical protein